jgi:hypothetical protein
MAASSVEVCNSALIKLGASTISSLSDGTKAANLCNAQYDRLRKEVLRAHPWNFAISFVALSATVNTPVWTDYTAEFLIPSDVLRILDTDLIYDQEWEIGYNVDGNKVLFTSASAVSIRYIKDITNTTRFDTSFDEVLAARIAADISYSLVQSQSVQQNMFRIYEQLLRDARSFDAQEHSAEQVQADEFTTAVRG